MRTDEALAIGGMAVLAFGVRAAGLMLAERLPQTGAVSRWFQQIPPAILVSIVAPAVITGGVAEKAAALVTAVTAALSRNLLLAMVLGVGTVWALRQAV